MRVVVPFDGADPKSSLAPLLSADERREFAAAMLRDVLGALDGLPSESPTITVLASAPPAEGTLGRFADADGVAVTVDDRSLDAVVNDALEGASPEDPVGVVMADLALSTPRALSGLLDTDEGTDAGDVVIAPGRGGGTNALVVRHPDFRVDYHGASYLDHLRIASEAGASVREIDSMRLSTDIDAPSDLAELMLHGDGEAVAWLREADFELVADEAGTVVRRESA
jgi:2-phospho-L-lactate guanylyltransferase